MRKRGFCCRPVSVCLSVCLSRWCIVFVCIHTAGDIVKLLSRPGSNIILVFTTPSADTQIQGEPLQQGRKIHGVGKFSDFRLKSLFISEMVQDWPIVEWNVNRKS